jgi:hypothetical protein
LGRVREKPHLRREQLGDSEEGDEPNGWFVALVHEKTFAEWEG